MVPNATVTLTNTDEGTMRTTKTNSVGDYQFLDVKAGNYQLDIEAHRVPEVAGSRRDAASPPGTSPRCASLPSAKCSRRSGSRAKP